MFRVISKEIAPTVRSQVSWSKAVFVTAQLGKRSLKLHYKNVIMQNLIIYLLAIFCRYALDSKDGYRSGLLQGTEALTNGRI